MGIRELLPDALAPMSGDAPAPQGTACFVAASPSGPLMVRLERGVRHACDAAIVLHRCDELLCGLQDWTGLALEWRWIATPSWRLSTGSHASVQWRGGDAPHGVLEVPWALLRGLPAPAPSLAACLQWPTLHAVLAVSQPRLPLEELRLVEPGGAVVLPESLSAPWHGRLRASDEPPHAAGVAVELASPSAPRLVRQRGRNVAASDEGTGIACEVQLGTGYALPADLLCGWCEGETLDAVGSAATLWRAAGVCGPAQRLGTGRLMPLGEGWVLSIESLDEAEPTLIFTS
jgi:hypothetical protein